MNATFPQESRPQGMRAWYHCAARRGYAGTALYAAKRPREVRLGFGSKEFDAEGRYVEAQFSTVTVISVYFPSGSSGPHRQESKFRFLARFLPHLKRLAASGREFILCGDINIAHREIDLKNWRSNQKHSGLPARRARVAVARVRAARLGRCVSHARSAARALHVVEQLRAGVCEKRRLADRLSDRDAGHRQTRTNRGDLHGSAFLGSRAADHRVHRPPMNLRATRMIEPSSSTTVRAPQLERHAARVRRTGDAAHVLPRLFRRPAVVARARNAVVSICARPASIARRSVI